MTKASVIRIAVDLTPLRPGGENGGAKTLILTLLEEFSSVQSSDFEYLLIAESWNYQELLEFQSSNITCLLKSDIFFVPAIEFNQSKEDYKSTLSLLKLSSLKSNFKEILKILLDKSVVGGKRVLKSLPFGLSRLAPSLKKYLSEFRNSLLRQEAVSTMFKPKTLQESYNIDLLFCPFSAPTFAEPGLPLVAIAYDLQHLDLPFLFSGDERSHRTRFLKDLLHKASQIICISEFTRQSFLTHLDGDSERLTSIPICIHERLTKIPNDLVETTLSRLGLGKRQYLFFPANFWPHKNHRMLLAAYSVYKKEFPLSALNLVFTGALEEPQRDIKELVFKLGCENYVHFLGFLSQAELVAVWQGCKGLIFPSLYEGFGIPLLEAMWFDKPIACSSIGSLPEVGGDAAIYFDPRKPESIADAIAAVAHNDALTTHLRGCAQQRLQMFSQRSMTEQYLDVFRAAVSHVSPPRRLV
ncbi:glycosyltransferase family 4 protein [Nodosilinea sp. FACHB-131]|uniref:glycosyltransferase family 4 protein n=1 Tax=Cyanophyceae TaxID=3028117 RepID=UPI001686C144|nr:glycosyltransferase family 1 protein [Nodosilinea sp. FACHB-131]MBD1876541.1 glycosyltransferase family 4 protein [Nodosilinea sp. FACHB-131]